MEKHNDFKKIPDTDFATLHHIDDSYTMDTLHFHNVFEIYFAYTGGLKYFVDNRIYPVEKNDLFIFNHLDLHRIGIPSGVRYERFIIIFNPDYIQNMCTDTTDLLECFVNRGPNFCHRLPLSSQQAETYMSMFKRAQSHMKTNLYGDDVYKKIVLAKILVFVNKLYRDNQYSIPVRYDAEYAKIKPILNYINENIHQKLSLDHLGNHFYISKFHLCKIFKEVTGFTVNEYIVYRRIIKATELLRKNFLVSQVSEMVGFKNNCHFITTFKKILGITPKQYALSSLTNKVTSVFDNL
ncbi:MAG TPA: AraC family transcriptional regulator [Clostridiaceae bacterium]|jgi:AraC-like DNA-binding protein|nr:AraC family transcriptional regulator [Clostridiaceae bacterium]